MDNNQKGKTRTDRRAIATEELLTEMYRNVTMGSENLLTVVGKIRKKDLMTNVTGQLEKYGELTNDTAKLLAKHGIAPEEPALMKKVMSKSGIMVNAAVDSSPEHLAQMIAKGTATGADQLEKKYEQFRDEGCDGEVLGLCEKILDFERDAISKANQMR